MSVELVFVPVVTAFFPRDAGPRMRIVNGFRPAEVVTKAAHEWVVRDIATGELMAVPLEELEEANRD